MLANLTYRSYNTNINFGVGKESRPALYYRSWYNIVTIGTLITTLSSYASIGNGEVKSDLTVSSTLL